MKLKPIRLTASERQIILERREKIVAKESLKKFQIKALSTASRWFKWSDKNGSGLTFSTFVNDFNYQESDSEQMYKAVCSILSVVEGLGTSGLIEVERREQLIDR